MFRGIATSQIDELRYGELAHDMQIGDEGTNLALSVRRTLSEPGYTLEPLEFKSNSTSGDVVLSHPVVRSRRGKSARKWNFQLSRFRDHCFGGGFFQGPTERFFVLAPLTILLIDMSVLTSLILR